MKDRESPVTSWSTAVRQFFRPRVLAIVALALTVGGSGYGYKLSQYLPHSDVTRASHARMWVDHRDNSLAEQVRHQLDTPEFQGSYLAATGNTLLPHRSYELVLADPPQSRILTFVSPLHPLRAPPTLSSLA